MSNNFLKDTRIMQKIVIALLLTISLFDVGVAEPLKDGHTTKYLKLNWNKKITFVDSRAEASDNFVVRRYGDDPSGGYATSFPWDNFWIISVSAGLFGDSKKYFLTSVDGVLTLSDDMDECVWSTSCESEDPRHLDLRGSRLIREESFGYRVIHE